MTDAQHAEQLAEALRGISDNDRPVNWDEVDDEYAEQSHRIIAAWKRVDAALAAWDRRNAPPPKQQALL